MFLQEQIKDIIICEKWRRLGKAQQDMVEEEVRCYMVSRSCDDPQDECDFDEEEVEYYTPTLRSAMWHSFADSGGLRPPSVRPNHLAAPSRRRANAGLSTFVLVHNRGRGGEKGKCRSWRY